MARCVGAQAQVLTWLNTWPLMPAQAAGRGQSILGPGLCPQSHCLLPPVPAEGSQFYLGGRGGAGLMGHVASRKAEKARAGLRVVHVGGHGDWVAGLLLWELGLRLGLQLPGGGARPPPSRVPPPDCPFRVSKPSEFSSISWIRGGMEPGISIFRVITRSAPVGTKEEVRDLPRRGESQREGTKCHPHGHLPRTAPRAQ